jgi:drug/metabolite transporter (DMT)-like permease
MLAAAVTCALLAAASNALASVLQRRANRDAAADRSKHRGLIATLVRRPRWLTGIACLTAGFLLQATALSFGGLALVQPLMTVELPMTLVLAALVARTALDRGGWVAIVLLTGGLALLLAGAAPTRGKHVPDGEAWLAAVAASAALIGTLVLVGGLRRGGARAGLFGAAAGLGFALTAALMKAAVQRFNTGPAAVFSSWQLYAMAGAGLCSLLILQYALQSGSLAVAQPALTISDPIASVVLGVMLFAERVRLGGWIAVEAAGAALLLLGSARLASSPAWRTHVSSTDRDRSEL